MAMHLPVHILRLLVFFAFIPRVTGIHFNLVPNLKCFLDILLPRRDTLFSLFNQYILVSSNVIFHEHIFPFDLSTSYLYVRIPGFYNLIWFFCFCSPSLFYSPSSYFFLFSYILLFCSNLFIWSYFSFFLYSIFFLFFISLASPEIL